MNQKSKTCGLALILLLIFTSNAIAAQIPGKFIQDAAITAAKLSSGAATNGQVATANGSGGVTYASPGASGTPTQELPSGTVNGSNVTFTLAQTPAASLNVHLFLNGLMQTQGSGKDYTISGATITMAVAPETEQNLWAAYIY